MPRALRLEPLAFGAAWLDLAWLGFCAFFGLASRFGLAWFWPGLLWLRLWLWPGFGFGWALSWALALPLPGLARLDLHPAPASVSRHASFPFTNVQKDLAVSVEIHGNRAKREIAPMWPTRPRTISFANGHPPPPPPPGSRFAMETNDYSLHFANGRHACIVLLAIRWVCNPKLEEERRCGRLILVLILGSFCLQTWGGGGGEAAHQSWQAKPNRTWDKRTLPTLIKPEPNPEPQTPNLT